MTNKKEISASKLMADAKFYGDYSRFNEEKGRYESWDEAVERVMSMHKEKYAAVLTPELYAIFMEIEEAYKAQEMLGAQRALQFGGKQLLRKNAKMYNCVSSYVDRPAFFGEFMWLLLCGAGAGFSVQRHHIDKLPALQPRNKSVKKFVVPDSIEGWAQAFDVLFSSFFIGGGKHPEFERHPVWFDLSQIRPKGAEISGGFKAPGPEPLQHALTKVELLLSKVEKGAKLRPIEAYDACMYMADAVISGGVRRSATICLFSKDDEEMIRAKTGSWFVDNPQRGRSNNSVMLLRDEVTFEEFKQIMKSVEDSGEPGFIFTDSLEFTFNPCVEIGKFPVTVEGVSGWQGCNLSEINGGKSVSEEVFYRQCRVASAIATLQAGYTDFEFLSPASKQIFEHEALIGVSITGWMNNPHILFNEEILRKGAQIVKEVNKLVAGMIGIRPAARTTCAKPSGNASVLLQTFSGIHGGHAPRFLRHVQMNNEMEVLKAFKKSFPEMVEPSVWSTNGTDSVIAFPIISKEGSKFREELLGVKMLEYVKLAQQVWVEEGTNVELCRHPKLRHNISNTISVDNWEDVTQYLYENRQWFCGVSLMAASGDKAFPQAPFTEVLTEQQIVDKYGAAALFASGLVTRALDSFGDLWKAVSTASGYGEDLSMPSHENSAKRDWVRQFLKFAGNHFPEFTMESASGTKIVEGDLNKAGDLLKDVYNLHKWSKITRNLPDYEVDIRDYLGRKEFVDVGTLSGAACAGGDCEITF